MCSLVYLSHSVLVSIKKTGYKSVNLYTLDNLVECSMIVQKKEKRLRKICKTNHDRKIVD